MSGLFHCGFGWDRRLPASEPKGKPFRHVPRHTFRSGSSLEERKTSSQARLSQTLQDPVCDGRGGHFAGARDRGDAAIFSLSTRRCSGRCLFRSRPAWSTCLPRRPNQAPSHAARRVNVTTSSVIRCSRIWSAPRRSSPALPLTSGSATFPTRVRREAAAACSCPGRTFGVGLQPAIGRLLDYNDDRNIGGHFVAVLSHWTGRRGWGATLRC